MAQDGTVVLRSSSGRMRSLDALRGLAACVVAFGYHAQYMFDTGAFPDGSAGPIIAWIHAYGWTAVDLFFVLSGFVFAHVYRSGRASGGQTSVANFALARIARLYPLHLVMLGAAALLFAGSPNNTLGAFVAHLTMTQAIFAPVGYTFVGPSWSISVEMFCYLLFALGVFRWPRAQSWIRCTAILSGTAILCLDPAGRDPTIINGLGRGVLGFFVGQALWHRRAFLMSIPKAWLVFALAAGFIIDLGPLGPVLPLTLLGWPALILLALRSRTLESAWMGWLGDRSYGIYLSHMLFVDLANHSVSMLPATPANLLVGHAVLIILVVSVSDILYRWVELPARQGIRRRWGVPTELLATDRVADKLAISDNGR